MKLVIFLLLLIIGLFKPDTLFSQVTEQDVIKILQEKYHPQGVWTSSDDKVSKIVIIKHIGESYKDVTLEVSYYFNDGTKEFKLFKYGGLKGHYIYWFYKNGKKVLRTLAVWKLCLKTIYECETTENCDNCERLYHIWKMKN